MKRVNLSLMVASLLGAVTFAGTEENLRGLRKPIKAKNKGGEYIKATKGKRHASQRSRSNRRS